MGGEGGGVDGCLACFSKPTLTQLLLDLRTELGSRQDFLGAGPISGSPEFEEPVNSSIAKTVARQLTTYSSVNRQSALKYTQLTPCQF